MPAAVYQGQRTVTVEQLPIPEPPDGHVRIEVSHCGICGSDLHFMMEDWSRPGAVHGHEYSGEIVALGAGVTDWMVGDRVVAGPGHGCGTCPLCLDGRANLCVGKERAGIDAHQGAFAAYKVVDTESLFRIPPAPDLRTAALPQPVAPPLPPLLPPRLAPRQPPLDNNRSLLTVLVTPGFVEYPREALPGGVPLRAEGKLPVGRLIEPDDVPLGQMQFAMEQLVAGELAGKVMVIPHA